MTKTALGASVIQALLFSGLWISTRSPSPELVLFVSLLLFWTLAEPACQQSFASDPRRREDADWESVLAGILILVSFVLAAAGPLQRSGDEVAIPKVVGLLSAVAGVLLRCAAIAKLGRFFHNDISLSSAQIRVTTGIYRYLRHPSEWGTILATAGICLSAENVVAALFSVVVLTPLAIYRTGRENTLISLCPEENCR